ncbi:unnamed protein product [Rotaria magnacalcarata]|uniref:Uncharacterized protein n=6 Tax=Rotaria magnacalcarata TaxID=392030 RepID=A0A819YWH7_9BILA|nr:unnamed protein product [Rotaria magnacalcarata]CAF4155287.1 unnamed protein product [Rotaria magnacalcarata]
MSSNAWPTTDPKRKRIMIITADENILDQIEKSNNVSLLKQIVIPSEDNNSEKPDKQSKAKSSCEKNKTKDGSLTCVVCGSPASGYNFSAIVCESCKAFFRRNARKDPAAFRCMYKDDCQITFQTRRNCPACRLSKCFNSGMQRDRLLTVEQKAAKRRQIEENRNLALNSNSKINEQEFQLSSSTFSDDLLMLTETDILLTDFTDLLSSQPQQTLLSPEDLQRVETISCFYQNRIELAARNGLPWDPSMHAQTFLDVLNSHSVSVMRLLSFFKQIPEFNQLNVDDKVTLIKYNLLTVLGINSALSYNIETQQLIESDSDLPSNVQYFRVLHGYNISMQTTKIFGAFLNIAKRDRKIIELTVIILILTKGFSVISDHDEPLLNDIMSAHRVQNDYTELLWKYMETTHGYKQAVDLFSELIRHVISWQVVYEQMRNNILRTLSPEDIGELVPIMKSTLRIS